MLNTPMFKVFKVKIKMKKIQGKFDRHRTKIIPTKVLLKISIAISLWNTASTMPFVDFVKCMLKLDANGYKASQAHLDNVSRAYSL